MVVIGGGFTSASAALQLAKNDARVILLEEENVPHYIRYGNIEAASKPAHFEALKKDMRFSMCYVGLGVTLATYLGKQMANAALGKRSSNPFADISIPRVPFYQGKAWFVNIGKVWFRFLDMTG